MTIGTILIRGLIGMNHDVKKTLELLKLQKKHTLVLLEDNPVTRGMLQKAKDAITWGTVNEETKALLAKKGEGPYHLQPPKGGFERKGIKQPYTKGGALGNRKEAINDLIKKML